MDKNGAIQGGKLTWTREEISANQTDADGLFVTGADDGQAEKIIVTKSEAQTVNNGGLIAHRADPAALFKS